MFNFGNIFKISIYGASHNSCLGVLIEGVKPGIKITKDMFSEAIKRRKPAIYGTPRTEEDEIIIKSGIFNDYTTGTPLVLEFENKNVRPKDYSNLVSQPRPSHADFVAMKKYNGFQDYRGGGAFSGRMTLAIVAAGVVAKAIKDFNISSEIVSLKGDSDKSNFKTILADAKTKGDSVGGVIEISIKDMMIGLGEPYFDSLESCLSHGLFSIPAVKGVSFGAGFAGASLYGSEYNDVIINKEGKTKTNNDGGINGGISNGNDIIINVAIKPTPSISLAQDTFNFKEDEVTKLVIEGRHDQAIILRMPVVLESICQIVLTDLYLRGNL